MEKNITIESIRNKSYEEMSREEKQFFCENGHLLCEDTQEDNGIIIVDDIDSYISKRNLVNVSELENRVIMENGIPKVILNEAASAMGGVSIEEAKVLAFQVAQKIMRGK